MITKHLHKPLLIAISQRAVQAVGEGDFALVGVGLYVFEVDKGGVVDTDEIMIREHFLVILEVFGAGNLLFLGEVKMGAIAIGLTVDDIFDV